MSRAKRKRVAAMRRRVARRRADVVNGVPGKFWRAMQRQKPLYENALSDSLFPSMILPGSPGVAPFTFVQDPKEPP